MTKTKPKNDEWDLEEEVIESTERTPAHFYSINESFGDYRIVTSQGYQITGKIHLCGRVSLSRTKRETVLKIKKFFSRKKPTIETSIDWEHHIYIEKQSEVQLYHPREVAKAMAKELEHNSIKVNEKKLINMFEKAFKPYVNKALNIADMGLNELVNPEKVKR